MAPRAGDLTPNISPGVSLLQLRHRGQRIHTCNINMSVNIEKNKTEMEVDVKILTEVFAQIPGGLETRVCRV